MRVDEYSLTDPLTPDWTWKDLEEVLNELAGSEERRGLVKSMISAIRKQAVFLPSRESLKQVVAASWIILDERPGPIGGLGPMLLEAT